MHDYTVQRIHDDRTREFEREADQSALAAIAREGRRQLGFRAVAWHWLSAPISRPSGSRGNPEPDGLGGGFRPSTHPELPKDV